MNEEELTKLESKIYIFSVDVFSFIKTLINNNFTNENTTGLLNASNLLYSKFLDLLEISLGKNKHSVLKECLALSESCAVFLNKIEVKDNLLNERIDLLIEAKEIVRKLQQLDFQ
jgi:hypothetical protein